MLSIALGTCVPEGRDKVNARSCVLSSGDVQRNALEADLLLPAKDWMLRVLGHQRPDSCGSPQKKLFSIRAPDGGKSAASLCACPRKHE